MFIYENKEELRSENEKKINFFISDKNGKMFILASFVTTLRYVFCKREIVRNCHISPHLGTRCTEYL